MMQLYRKYRKNIGEDGKQAGEQDQDDAAAQKKYISL